MDVLALHCIAPQWAAPGWNPIWPPMETNEVELSHSGLGFYIYFPPVHRPPPWRRGFRKIESNARLSQVIRDQAAMPWYPFPSFCLRKDFEWWREMEKWGRAFIENGNWWDEELSRVGFGSTTDRNRLWGIGQLRSTRHFSLVLLLRKAPFYLKECFFRHVWSRSPLYQRQTE